MFPQLILGEMHDLFSETDYGMSEYMVGVHIAIADMYTNKWLLWSSSWAWFYHP